jgi:anaerobic sulfite reductase subunit A
MAYLCTEMQERLAAENLPGAAASLVEQKEFLMRHLLNWVPAFCAEVQKCAETNFYKAVAKMTSGFLRMEMAIVDDLVKESGVKPA